MAVGPNPDAIFGAYIRECLAGTSLTPAVAAKGIGISQATLHEVLQGKKLVLERSLWPKITFTIPGITAEMLERTAAITLGLALAKMLREQKKLSDRRMRVLMNLLEAE